LQGRLALCGTQVNNKHEGLRQSLNSSYSTAKVRNLHWPLANLYSYQRIFLQRNAVFSKRKIMIKLLFFPQCYPKWRREPPMQQIKNRENEVLGIMTNNMAFSSSGDCNFNKTNSTI